MSNAGAGEGGLHGPHWLCCSSVAAGGRAVVPVAAMFVFILSAVEEADRLNRAGKRSPMGRGRPVRPRIVVLTPRRFKSIHTNSPSHVPPLRQAAGRTRSGSHGDHEGAQGQEEELWHLEQGHDEREPRCGWLRGRGGVRVRPDRSPRLFPDRPQKENANRYNYRDRATINRIKMYKSGGVFVRDKNGKVLKAAPFQQRVKPGTVARIEPNRRWFGNTRVVGPRELEQFRDAMEEVKKDPYQVVMHRSKLPMSLVTGPTGPAPRVHILDTQPFGEVFGPNRRRKRPTLATLDVAELQQKATERADGYDESKDAAFKVDGYVPEQMEFKDPIFNKGQSKRIWGELYKVIDASDVIIQVLLAVGKNPRV